MHLWAVRLPLLPRLLPRTARAGGPWWTPTTTLTAMLARTSPAAPLSTTRSCPAKPMPSRPRPPPEDEFEEVFLKGSGPGGQKILRHRATGIVVKSQATRSRSQNRTIARQLLAARLDELNNGAQSRTAIVGAVKQRRAASAAKKTRRKYRRLEEEKAAAVAAAAAAAAEPVLTPAENPEGEGGEEAADISHNEWQKDDPGHGSTRRISIAGPQTRQQGADQP